MRVSLSSRTEMDGGADAEVTFTIAQPKGSQKPTAEELTKIRNAMHAALAKASETYNEWMAV